MKTFQFALGIICMLITIVGFILSLCLIGPNTVTHAVGGWILVPYGVVFVGLVSFFLLRDIW
jgi:hypothetical protein